MSARPPWSELRARLEEEGFRPSKGMGQNFLLDENLLRAIVSDAQVGEGDCVLEVGPGLGFLTAHLLAAGARVLALELDARLARLCRELLGDPPRLELVVADALAGKNALSPELEQALARPPFAEGQWRLVANLPYGIAGPLLALLLGRAHPPRSLTVLVQSEVAERLVARPGEAEWGPLALRLALGWEARIARRVPPGLFWPRPRVDSALVHAVARADAPPSAHRAALVELARSLFRHPRQALRRTFGEWLGSRERALELLQAAGLSGSERPSQLAPQALERLLALSQEIPSEGGDPAGEVGKNLPAPRGGDPSDPV